MRKVRRIIVGLVAVAVVVGSPGAGWVRAQAPSTDAANPAFEAATVKPNKSGPGPIRLMFQPGGRFSATNVTLKMLISAAYGTPQPIAEFQISGGPRWLDSDRFDVVAKAAGDPELGPNAPPVMFLMIRALLEERFQLKVHNETKELPIFALVMAKSDGKLGPQLHSSAADCAAMMAAARARGGQPPPLPAPGERPPCGMRMFPGNLSGGSTTMAQLTNVLARFVSRTVVDRTGLGGAFDLDLTWTPDHMPQGDPPPGAPPLPAIDPNGPSLFTALQEQLGLKLDSTKGPVNVLVIDRAEPPTED